MNLYLNLLLVFCINSMFRGNMNVQSKERKSSHCVIIVHNDNKASSRNYLLLQMDRFGLDGHGIMNAFSDPPPYSLDTSKPSVAIFDIFITKPISVYIEYNEFYIQPNDTIELSVDSKGTVYPNLKIRRGISFFLNEVGKKSRFGIINDSIGNLATFKKKTTYPSISIYNKKAEAITNKMISENPNIGASKECMDFIHNYCLELAVSSFMFHLLHPHPRAPNLDSNIVLLDTIKSFLANYSKQPKLIKTVLFWATFGDVAVHYVPELKKNNFDYETIQRIIQPYNPDVQQFFLIKWLQEYNYIIRKDSVSHAKILAQITYPPFLSFKEKFASRMRAKAQDYILDNLQNSIIYDCDYKQIKFV